MGQIAIAVIAPIMTETKKDRLQWMQLRIETLMPSNLRSKTRASMLRVAIARSPAASKSIVSAIRAVSHAQIDVLVRDARTVRIG